MLDFEAQLESLKAAWIPRIYQQHNLINKIPEFYFKKLAPNIDILLKMSSFDGDIFKSIPKFYFQVLKAFNKCKNRSNLDNMKHHEILQQVIWSNHLFTINKKSIHFNNWIKGGLIYVKDLIINNSFLNINEIYTKLQNKQNWISEYYQINSAMRNIREIININEANFTNIPKTFKLKAKNSVFCLNNQKSKFFYDILRSKRSENWYMKKNGKETFAIQIMG